MKKYDPIVFLENPSPRPGKTSATVIFKFGRVIGQIEGILGAAEIPFILVHPRTWSLWCHVGDKEATSKERSIKAYIKLWPAHEAYLMGLPKYKREALVDAALIGRWGWEQIRRGLVVPPGAQGHASLEQHSTSSPRRKSVRRNKPKAPTLPCDPSS